MVQKWQGKTVAVDWMSRSAGASVEQGWAVEGFGGREFLMNGSFADVVKEVAGRLGDVGWEMISAVPGAWATQEPQGASNVSGYQLFFKRPKE